MRHNALRELPKPVEKTPMTPPKPSEFEPLDIRGPQPTAPPGGCAILFVAAIVGLISLMSLGCFLFQATYRLPSGEAFMAVEPGWVIGHLIRGLGLAFVTWQLLAYYRALKRGALAGPGFLARHASLWNTIAIALGLMLAYALLYTFGRRS
jgi:hypothetical protein